MGLERFDMLRECDTCYEEGNGLRVLLLLLLLLFTVGFAQHAVAGLRGRREVYLVQRVA